jgi:hypothetical protein
MIKNMWQSYVRGYEIMKVIVLVFIKVKDKFNIYVHAKILEQKRPLVKNATVDYI